MTGELLHIHLLLNCFHKCTDIYDGIGFLVLKRAVEVEAGSTLYLSTCIYTHTPAYIQTCMPTCQQTYSISVFWISVFCRISRFL